MDINVVKDGYTCLICQNIYTNPEKLTKCGHIFCKNCLENYIKNLNLDSKDKKNEMESKSKQNTQCPLCRNTFSLQDIIQDYSLINEMKQKSIKCECGKIMFLSEYNNHSDTCQKIINDMQNQLKNKKIEIRQDKIQKNRQTFDCTLCNKKNFDRVGYINHIKSYHPKDRGVCAICKAQPWGDPNYKTHIFGHINMRHKFDYDTVVDYNDDEDEVLKRVLLESKNDK